MSTQIHDIQHRKAGTMPDSAAYTLRETAAMFGTSYSGFREAMLRNELPDGLTPFKVGGVWRFPKATVHKILGMED